MTTANPTATSKVRIATLMADDDVTAKTGVYSYVPGGERVLSIRKFREADRRAAFERQEQAKAALKRFEKDQLSHDKGPSKGRGGPDFGM